MDRPSNEYLLERFGRLAQSFAVVAAKRSPFMREDFSQDAYLALFRAADTFDWEASDDAYGFGAYLKLCVQSEVSSDVAKVMFATTGGKNVVSRGVLHQKSAASRLDESAEFVWDDSSDVEALEAVREVAERVLSDKQFAVFDLYYLCGIVSDTEVAQVINSSQQAVEQLRKRAEAKIRKELG